MFVAASKTPYTALQGFMNHNSEKNILYTGDQEYTHEFEGDCWLQECKGPTP